MTDFADEPDLFLCHDFVYKPLLLYGSIRFSGRSGFTMTMVSNRHGACTGTGEAAWSRAQGRRHVDPSGRFACRDGAQGGQVHGALKRTLLSPRADPYAGD